MPPTQAQLADPQADPHDDIVAILRGEDSPRTANDPSELRIGLADRLAATPQAPPVDPALRPAPVSEDRVPPPASGARPGRRFLRFLFTVCIGVAATIAWQSYGEAAKQMLAGLAPQLFASSQLDADGASAPEQLDAAPAQDAAEATPAAATAADGTPAAPAPAAEQAAAAPDAAAQAAAPPAPPAPDLTPLIEGMSREIASLREAVEELKAGQQTQQKMSRDLAKDIKDIAKAAEQESKRKVATTPPPPPTPRPQRYAAPPPPSQGAIRREVYAPPPSMQTQLPPERDYYSPRPPLPLR
jgi:hypothetical protein